MKRKPVFIAVFMLVGISSYFLWANSSVREGLDPDNDFTAWQPTADVIRKEMPVGTQTEREQAFAQLFQKRFRKHDPGKAVGVHFVKNGKIHLLTPARLEPWNVDRIALMLHQETQRNFQKTYEIDIYETFIGTPPIKIAEMRPSPRTAEEVIVRYHYPRLEPVIVERSGQSFQPRAAGLFKKTAPPAPKPTL